MKGSLAYRRNESEILYGTVPDKYLRLLQYIPKGKAILEIGAAEGVLALVLAERDPSARVTALEMRPDRHQAALDLKARWRGMGRHVDGCWMAYGDIRERFDLLEGIDVVVGVRSIYYLRESIHDVFAAVSQHASDVVLCGNPNRALRFEKSYLPPDDSLGPFNYYAGIDGMSDVLTRAGYAIGAVVKEGDPIVTGRR